MIKPPRLRRGDTVAVLSPSSGAPAAFPRVFDSGLAALRSEFGLRIKEYPTARMEDARLHADPELRARDVNRAFLDGEVRAIIASIGGDDSVRVLPYLDRDAIKAHPKVIMGYSDTTTLLTSINQMGLVTFHGPSVMAGFSQMHNFPAYVRHVGEMLFGSSRTYSYKPYATWANKYPDWSEPGNSGKVSRKLRNSGWRWLQGGGTVAGELYGGNIEILEMLNGTRFWPHGSFWEGKLLFLETSEEKPSPQYVKYALRNLGMQGILGRIGGMLIGRASDYTAKEKRQLEDNVLSVVSGEFGRGDMPIIANMDFGHTDPQFVLPLGVRAELDCRRRTFRLLERPTSG